MQNAVLLQSTTGLVLGRFAPCLGEPLRGRDGGRATVKGRRQWSKLVLRQAKTEASLHLHLNGYEGRRR